MTAASGRMYDMLLGDSELKDHLMESAIGAHLLALANEHALELFWWREGTDGVDFALSGYNALVAIEVKSGCSKSQGGMAAFLAKYPQAQRIVVGGGAAGACAVEEFLLDEGAAMEAGYGVDPLLGEAACFQHLSKRL